MLVATPYPQPECNDSFSLPCDADFFSGQLFSEILQETLGLDGAFVLANQLGDDFDLSLDLSVKLFNTRTPGHGPARYVAVQHKKYRSGSHRLGRRGTLNKDLWRILEAWGEGGKCR
jgi:hypothetical protein